MEEIEAEEGAGHKEGAVGANRPPARGGSRGPELMDRCRKSCAAQNGVGAKFVVVGCGQGCPG
jgi:hypothetical protein